MTASAIVAPVSRLLAVADLARSAEFYQGVLGFETRERDTTTGAVEMVSGPAHIELRVDEGAIDGTFDYRPRGSAMLFFQTDDIAALHVAIRARGGTPSEIEKVNWIKVRMFEIRDPDGHTLWFGQSYHEDEQPRPARPMMEKILPELPLDDVAAGIAYYRDLLGFAINYAQHDIGVMYRDEVTVLLIARTERHTGIGSACVYIDNADALYTEFVAKGAKVQGPPVSQPWGLRVFDVLDPEGNKIAFAQPFE
jgi:predicted enzyme related to lactoylglutathione lyase